MNVRCNNHALQVAEFMLFEIFAKWGADKKRGVMLENCGDFDIRTSNNICQIVGVADWRFVYFNPIYVRRLEKGIEISVCGIVSEVVTRKGFGGDVTIEVERRECVGGLYGQDEIRPHTVEGKFFSADSVQPVFETGMTFLNELDQCLHGFCPRYGSFYQILHIHAILVMRQSLLPACGFRLLERT